MGRRLGYMFLGFSIGLLVALVLETVINKRLVMGAGLAGLGLSCASISVWIAERKKKVKSLEEINRPLNLFPPLDNIN